MVGGTPNPPIKKFGWTPVPGGVGAQPPIKKFGWTPVPDDIAAQPPIMSKIGGTPSPPINKLMTIVWNNEGMVGWTPSAEDIAAQPPIMRRIVYILEEPGHSTRIETYRREPVPPELIYRREEQGQQAERQMRSIIFYQQIGHPEFAGKYPALNVPSDYVVSDVVETEHGLEFTFDLAPSQSFQAGQPQQTTTSEQTTTSGYTGGRWGDLRTIRSDIAPLVSNLHMPELGLAETLAQFQVKPLISYLGIKRPPMKVEEFIYGVPEKTRPFAGFGGVVAPFEATAYSFGRLAGFQTPRLPPTVFSFSAGEAVGYGSEYAAGTIAGDILLSMGLGKFFEKISSPVTGYVKEKASSWLTASYEKSVLSGGTYIPSLEKSVIWQPSLTEKIVMRFTGAKPFGFPSSVVGLPTMVEKEALGLRNFAKFDVGMDILEMTISPKTVGFGLTTPLVEKTVSGGVEIAVKEVVPYAVFQFGRQVTLGEPHGMLGFEKTKYSLGSQKRLGFEKRNLPSMSDLLKDTKAELSLQRIVKSYKTVLPSTAIISDVGGGFGKAPSYALGFGLTLTSRSFTRSSSYSSKKQAVNQLPKSMSVQSFKPSFKMVNPQLVDFYEEPFEVQKQKLFPQVYSVERQKERQTYVLIPKLIPKLSPKTTLAPNTAQITPQKTKQHIVPKIPFMPPLEITFGPPFKGSRKFDYYKSSGKLFNKSVGGSWFFRKYPVSKIGEITRFAMPTHRRRKRKR